MTSVREMKLGETLSKREASRTDDDLDGGRHSVDAVRVDVAQHVQLPPVVEQALRVGVRLAVRLTRDDAVQSVRRQDHCNTRSRVKVRTTR